MVVICLAGVLLGVSYNWFGLQSPRGWGLTWIGEDPLEVLDQMETVSAGDASEAPGEFDPYLTDNTDPAAIAADPLPVPDLPEIPAMGRPVKIELEALKLYVDAEGALVIDARDPEEYGDGHIAGAINLPYDRAISDPAMLETLGTGGRPIIVYCGGGACEASLNLAFELLAVGHERIAVYEGGFPEWSDAGYPVERGEARD